MLDVHLLLGLMTQSFQVFGEADFGVCCFPFFDGCWETQRVGFCHKRAWQFSLRQLVGYLVDDFVAVDTCVSWAPSNADLHVRESSV